ncbi:hypothetical protein D3C81_2157110 [compost metagenome]
MGSVVNVPNRLTNRPAHTNGCVSTSGSSVVSKSIQAKATSMADRPMANKATGVAP